MSLIVHHIDGLFGDQKTKLSYTDGNSIWIEEPKISLSPTGRVAFGILGQRQNAGEQIKLLYKLAELYIEAVVLKKSDEVKLAIEDQIYELRFALKEVIVVAISQTETLYYNGNLLPKPKMLDPEFTLSHGTGETVFMKCLNNNMSIKESLAMTAKHVPTVGKVFDFIYRKTLRPFVGQKTEQKHISLKKQLKARKANEYRT